MDEPLHYLTAREALARFEARTLSPVELLSAVIERAERVEPAIHAFTETFYEAALAAARRAEARYARPRSRRRPLEGLPLAVKEESAIAGQRATQGSLLHCEERASDTSPAIARLLRAGAIVHARTTTPEFSCAGVTHSRLHGVTRNPWNLARSPGGSSGGSGAALAAGSTPLATGTDIWGSIRIPAACCGVVGFKPPHGRIPGDPPFNLDPYNHDGPMARSVADCALLANVMSGPHPRDASSLRPKLRIPERLGDVAGWKVAWSPDLGFAPVDPVIARNTERALDVFRELGCRIERVELDWGDEVLEAAKQHLGHLFGHWVARELDRAEELTPYARAFGEFGRTTTGEGFLRAMEVAAAMYARLGPILERHQVFVCPTTALPSLPADHDPTRDPVRIAGSEVDPVFGWILTYPFNMLSRCPVLSVPSGHDELGVPTGIQIVARHQDDVRAFRAAAAYESALGGFPRVSWES
jgi:amidase